MSIDELQSIVDKDINNMTMDTVAKCINVSKTVYAGIYSSACKKNLSSH